MSERRFHFRRGTWAFGEKIYLLAIMNVTPDSFSDGASHNSDPAYQVDRATQLFEEGADGVDIGAESTRPGYASISAEDEWHRLRPILRAVRQKFPKEPISVDTQKSFVARRALDEGADIINDIWGLSQDAHMAETIGSSDAGLILMYNASSPEENPMGVQDIRAFFNQQIQLAERGGINRNAILVDPGIGFRVQGEASWTILRNLMAFRGLGEGVLVGHSRKRFVGAVTGERDPSNRDVATAVLSGLLALNGADVLRVHNPRVSRQALEIAQKWGGTVGRD